MFFFFSSRRRHTRCALVTGVQTCALPISETNAWNMAFHAPQDGAGLAALYGGRAGLAAKLDQFFATPGNFHVGSYGEPIHEMLEARDVRMGQYGHSNQPSHHKIGRAHV